MHLTKIHYFTFDLDISHWKYCSVPFTLCDLHTYKSECVMRWVCKKNALFYLWSFQGHTKCCSLPFTSCDLGICSLKLLRQTFKEVMHLQETWWTDVCLHKWGQWTDFDEKAIYLFYLKRRYNKNSIKFGHAEIWTHDLVGVSICLFLKPSTHNLS